MRDNSDTLIGVLKKLAVAWGVGKVLAFASAAITTIQTIGGFLKTLRALDKIGGLRGFVLGTTRLIQNGAEWLVNTGAIIGNKVALLAHKAVGGVVWLAKQVVALGTASAAWIHNTAVIVANKVSLAAHKVGLVASTVASGVAAGATAALTAAQWALNAAFVATPIGWVVLGLAAIVAAGVALYKNWDTVKAKAGELRTKVKTVFGGVRDTITGAFDAAKEKVKGFFSWLDDKISSIPLLGDIYSGGKSALSWIGGKISGHAMGTPYFSGGLTRVNERGGEIMRLPSGTQIIPHDVSIKAAGGRGVTVNVTIQGNVIGNREYAEEMGDYVARRVLAACGNA